MAKPDMAVVAPDEASAGPPRFESIERLFVALESPLLNYALRMVRDSALAEDIVQDAFMKLHAQFGQVREPRRWLYRTVHNLALNQQRQSAKTAPLSLCADPLESPIHESIDPRPLPDENIARWEGIGLVRLSLKALDDRSRQLIHLKFNEDLSYKEISDRTGLKIGHVGYLLHHALKSIAAELAKMGVVP
ncbi:MAG: RNA polymerase sigma factor [Candidatus Omnitrophica bacterium]|nr:RNA polymerase sigma factor [Candidatus Omnitrophota bacterium]